MPTLNLKPAHKPVKAYYNALQQFEGLGISHETAVRDAFGDLLKSCCRQFEWTLVPEWTIKRPKLKLVRVDGALVDAVRLTHGFWEAKDSHDNLAKEVKKKFEVGYPKDNIIFQAPEQIILWQGGKQICDEDITKPDIIVDTLRHFFEYRPSAIAHSAVAASEFGSRVKDLAQAVVELIAKERKTNAVFIQAFSEFTTLCRQAINPNISESAVEKMLIQHLLIERIFRVIFNNPNFTRRNVIAVEIEKVITALTSKSFSRTHFWEILIIFTKRLKKQQLRLTIFPRNRIFSIQFTKNSFKAFQLN